MSDTLEIFGAEYTGVIGFKIKDENGNIITYTKGGGGASVTQDANGFIVLPPTGGGGGGPSATKHVIHLEFTDETDADIDVYYDDTLIDSMITAYTPTTYGGKTVTLAQLDNVTWYEPANIPLNTQLVDFTACTKDYMINTQGQLVLQEWYYATDFTPIASDMIFSYTAGTWTYIAFYNSSQSFLNYISVQSDGTVDPNDSNTSHGTLSGAKIPSNAAWVRLSGTYPADDNISLIRTA